MAKQTEATSRSARHSLSVAAVLLILLSTIAVRLVFIHVPAASDKLPDGYNRVLFYQTTVESWLSNGSLFYDVAKHDQIASEWDDVRGSRLPPDYDEAGPGDGKVYHAYQEDAGFLYLITALKRVTGACRWDHVLWIQAALSGLCAVAVFWLGIRLTGKQWVGWLAGISYALNPLEIACSTYPDTPVWLLYAAVAGLVLVCKEEWDLRSKGDLSLLTLLSLFLGWTILVRMTCAAIAMLAVAALAIRGRRQYFISACIAFMLVVLPCVASISYMKPKSDIVKGVGRPCVYHNLIAGAAEYGDLPGVSWRDEDVRQWIVDQGYDLNFYKHPLEYEAACEVEYKKIMAVRPELKWQVPAKRTWRLIVGWRPTFETPIGLVAMTIFKIGFLIGALSLLSVGKGYRDKIIALAALALVLASVVIHIPLSSLQVYYLAPSIVLGTPIAIGGWAVVAQWLRRGAKR